MEMTNLIDFIEEHKMDAVPSELTVSDIGSIIKQYGNSSFDLLNAGLIVGYYKAMAETAKKKAV